MSIAEYSKPALAAGCRWGGTQEQPILLFPEGAIKVEGTSYAILLLCDGHRTFSEILSELQRKYVDTGPERIRQDAGRFLQQLHEKRVVNL